MPEPYETGDSPLSWRGLFRKLPLETETARYILVSALDVFLTYLLIREPRFHEANPIARYFLDRWGMKGMIYYKFALVGLVVLIAQFIARKQLRTARGLLNGATLVVTGVLIYSSYLLARFHGYL